MLVGGYAQVIHIHHITFSRYIRMEIGQILTLQLQQVYHQLSELHKI